MRAKRTRASLNKSSAFSSACAVNVVIKLARVLGFMFARVFIRIIFFVKFFKLLPVLQIGSFSVHLTRVVLVMQFTLAL